MVVCNADILGTNRVILGRGFLFNKKARLTYEHPPTLTVWGETLRPHQSVKGQMDFEEWGEFTEHTSEPEDTSETEDTSEPEDELEETEYTKWAAYVGQFCKNSGIGYEEENDSPEDGHCTEEEYLEVQENTEVEENAPKEKIVETQRLYAICLISILPRTDLCVRENTRSNRREITCS